MSAQGAENSTICQFWILSHDNTEKEKDHSINVDIQLNCGFQYFKRKHNKGQEFGIEIKRY